MIWRSVPTLDLEDDIEPPDHEKIDQAANWFIESVFTVLLLRDPTKPIEVFRLKLNQPYISYSTSVMGRSYVKKLWVEKLYLVAPPTLVDCKFPSGNYSTLIVLKLSGMSMSKVSFVRFLSLKVLSLCRVCFPNDSSFKMFLSGCPNPEDLDTRNLHFSHNEVLVAASGEYKAFTNLIKATLHPILMNFPLKALPNAHFLSIVIYTVDLHGIPVFQNLTQLELYFMCPNWLLLELLKHCRSLQVLELKEVQPKFVPECLPLCLRRCFISGYQGSEGEFQFAKYIMRNAGALLAIKIYNAGYPWYLDLVANFMMLKNLALCERLSTRCSLSFN